jgi:hypothetical protein
MKDFFNSLLGSSINSPGNRSRIRLEPPPGNHLDHTGFSALGRDSQC